MRKRPNGAWELRVHVGYDRGLDGRRRRSVSRTFRGSKRDAEAALRALCAAVDEDRAVAATERGTVTELAREWLDAIEPKRSPMTVQRYRQILDGHVLPELGRMQVARVTPRHVDTYLRGRRQAGQSASSVNQHRAVLSGMFKLARRWGLTEHDPVRDVDRERIEATEIEVVDPKALRRMLAAVMAVDQTAGTFMRLVAATGLRRGEVCGLQWGDLDGDRLTVRRAVVQPTGSAPVVKDTKTHQVRVVTLDPETVAVLEDHRVACERVARLGGAQLGPWMFSGDEASRVPMRPERLSRWWRRWADAAGVDGRLHDLRHLHASFLLAEGVNPVEVAARLGHGSSATTLRIYAHVMPGRDDASVSAAAKLLG